MNALALELTRLIGNKELTFPHLLCIPCDQSPATETDFKRWMNEKGIFWKHNSKEIRICIDDIDTFVFYNSSKKLLEQETSTLEQIIELISSNQ